MRPAAHASDGAAPGPARVPSLFPLVFGRPVVTSAWHWATFLGAGVVLPACALAAAHAWVPRRPAEPPPLVLELVSTPPVAPLPLPPATARDEPPAKVPSPVRPRAKALAPGLRARAGKVMAKAPAPAAAPAPELDTDTDTVVTGEAEAYAGGVTASSGTSAAAVDEAPLEPAAPPVDPVAVTRAYLRELRELLAKEKRYPLAAQRLGVQGAVVVAFVVLADGRFDQVRVDVSSGSDLLDDAALATVRALSGRVARPRATGGSALPLKTALSFEIVPWDARADAARSG